MKTLPFLLILFFDFTLADREKPNIIFILTDDQGYGDVNAIGHQYHKTPHTNKLRSKRVSFDNFHVSPSCSPTRDA